MDWQEICAHPSLQDLPFKIETNEWGQIVMSPASNRHGRYQMKIGVLLEAQIGGEAISESPIATTHGVKVADVVWLSDGFVEKYGYETPYPHAPEICVEVLSPSNTMAEMGEKIVLYLAKGAREVWLCEADGGMRFFGNEGELKQSTLAPDFPASI